MICFKKSNMCACIQVCTHVWVFGNVLGPPCFLQLISQLFTLGFITRLPTLVNFHWNIAFATWLHLAHAAQTRHASTLAGRCLLWNQSGSRRSLWRWLGPIANLCWGWSFHRRWWCLVGSRCLHRCWRCLQSLKFFHHPLVGLPRGIYLPTLTAPKYQYLQLVTLLLFSKSHELA